MQILKRRPLLFALILFLGQAVLTPPPYGEDDVSYDTSEKEPDPPPVDDDRPASVNDESDEEKAFSQKKFGIEIGTRLVEFVPELFFGIAYRPLYQLNLALRYGLIPAVLTLCSDEEPTTDLISLYCEDITDLNVFHSHIEGRIRYHPFKASSFVVGFGLGYRDLIVRTLASSGGDDLDRDARHQSFFIHPGIGINRIFESGFTISIFVGYKIYFFTRRQITKIPPVVTGNLEKLDKRIEDAILDFEEAAGGKTFEFMLGMYFLF